MLWIRWKMSVWIWWLWLKVTPDCTGKEDIVRAIAGATIRNLKGEII